MKTRTQSLLATLLICTLLTSCATQGGQGSASQSHPCFDRSNDPTFNPQTSFVTQAILNPLAKIGGTLLATAAANYSQHYTGKLNNLLVKLVTPKKKKNRNQEFEQGGFPQDVNQGFSNAQESFPNDQGFTQQESFPQEPFPNDQGFVEQDPLPSDQNFDDQGFQEGFDPNAPDDIQSRGVPIQNSHAKFPSENPCHEELPDEPYYDQRVAQQGRPYGNQQSYDPNQGGYGQDPYGNQQGYDPNQGGYGQDPYGNQQGYDPNQGGYGQDPYANQQGYDPNQGGYDQDPYANQQGYDPNQGGYGQDPYGQQGQPYPGDPNAQIPQGEPYPGDPNAQPYGHHQGESYPDDPYRQPNQQDPYPSYPQGQENQLPNDSIGLEVVLVKKTLRNGVPVVLPIKDGDILKDGRGNTRAGDKFRIMFRPNSKSYVYVIAIDGSGWAQGIFPPPTSPLANPVEPGKEYVLPEGNNWFSLDQYRGIETLFFVASPTQRTDIEEILQSITGRERPASETPQQVTKVAMIPYGVGGARPSSQPFNVSTGTGPSQSIIPTSYFAQKAGQDLRLTRWFRHE